MEVIPGGLELDRYILKRVRFPWNSDDKRCFVRMFGRFIGTLHARGILHADLKTCNVVVSQSSAVEPIESVPLSAHPEEPSFPPDQVASAVHDTGDPGASGSGTDALPANNSGRQASFFLLDYDEVRFSYVIPMKKRVKNLVQIFLSTPSAIGAADRLCFLREYALHAGLNRKETRHTLPENR